VRRLLVATLFVSAAAIGYELVLMRMLSIVQWHHFAYMIISLALLGYGASGTAIAVFRQRFETDFERAIAWSALACSITMLGCFVVAQLIPFNALEIVWDSSQFAKLTLVYLVLFVPFFFAACCIGLAFTYCSVDARRIYFFDLLGAGAGATLSIGILFLLSPQMAIFLLVLLPLAASFIVAGGLAGGRSRVTLAQLSWLVVLALGVNQDGLELRISEYKGLTQALQVVDSQVVSESWSPLGMLTVVDSPTVPFRHAPGLSFNTTHIPPPQLAVFTDGDGMSAITQFGGDLADIAYLADMTSALPYVLLEQPRVLILGAGTGSDVLQAIYYGAREVVAVELNPQMIELVADRYAEFAGHLYGRPAVSVRAEEVRGFIARNAESYDLIQIGLLDSFGASGAGVQALNESYVYTVEAIREYLADLAAGGVVAVTRWVKVPPRDSLKLVATAAEALDSMGIEDPGERMAVLRSWNTVTLLIRNGDFSADEIGAIRRFAARNSFDTAWFPGMRREDSNRYNVLDSPYFYEGVLALLGDGAVAWRDRYKFDIRPATDDRPYFFHFFRWRTLPELLTIRKAGGAGLVEWGYLVLVATLLQALLIGALLILVPLAAARKRWPSGTAPRYGLYFLLLGLAFMFVEMAFIQKFILYLSHPLYSVAVVLSAFLVFAGVGSAVSGRVRERARVIGTSPVTMVVVVISLVASAYLVLLPPLFAATVGFADALKVAISIALIAPLAAAMGMPFPLGLERLSGISPDFVPWAWGINGFASVVSAVLATLMAIEVGFSVVIVLAIAFYGTAAAAYR
jgi:SAM-dependent methyltransferase